MSFQSHPPDCRSHGENLVIAVIYIYEPFLYPYMFGQYLPNTMIQKRMKMTTTRRSVLFSYQQIIDSYNLANFAAYLSEERRTETEIGRSG